MKKELFRKGFVLGIIVLFIGVAIAPGIIATVDLSDIASLRTSENNNLNNKLVEITVEVGNGEHKVMLTPDQAEELKNLISRTKTRLDAAKTKEETSAIFNDTVVSLFDFGILPEDMSIEDTKHLVNGMEQNPRIVNKLERWFNRNQVNEEAIDNFLCLIAGNTDKTLFIGPSLIPSLFLTIVTAVSIDLLDVFLSILFISGLFNSSFFKPININWGILFLLFGGLNFITWQINPLALGHMVILGGRGPFGMHLPAEGWINTIGLKGIKILNEFYGGILGFTGIKICFPLKDRTHFYMGAALMLIDI